jgi:hypothetical protein
LSEYGPATLISKLENGTQLYKFRDQETGKVSLLTVHPDGSINTGFVLKQ